MSFFQLTLLFKQMQQIFSHSKARKYVNIIKLLPDQFDSKNVQWFLRTVQL